MLVILGLLVYFLVVHILLALYPPPLSCFCFDVQTYPNIESTAEALNAWYSLYLVGYALAQNGMEKM
jgi:hypothetical protein